MSGTHERRALLLATLTSTLGAAGCASNRKSEDIQQHIVECSKQWTNCYITGNPAIMELILAPDFVNTNPRGRKSGKSAALQAAREGPTIFESAQAGPVEVRVFGGMALAFGAISWCSRREILEKSPPRGQTPGFSGRGSGWRLPRTKA